MDDLSRVLNNLVDDDPSRNVASIKNAVIADFVSSDKEVTVKSTDYFNHSYAPDLILQWKKDSSERHVFLRTTNDLDYLREDVTTVSDSKPILMPLVPLPSDADSGELEQESAYSQTLVAPPSTINAFSQAGRKNAVIGLLSRAVYKGGRGVVDQGRARVASETVAQGFVAAQRAEVESTRAAITLAEDLLNPSNSGQINRLLHAVWMGSGAAATAFPGATETVSSLDAEGLQLLLDISISDDPEFWMRIGAGLSLERLCETDVSSEVESLQYLVNYNLDRFRAKSCWVENADNFNLEISERRWSVASNVLVLQTRSYRSYFSTRPLSALSLPFRQRGPFPSIGELLDRAQQAEINISEVRIEAEDGRQLDYRTSSEGSLAEDSLLRDLSSVIGRSSHVQSAIISLRDGSRYIKCDFETGTATGRTVAKLYLSEFLTSALPLLVDASRRERVAIAELPDFGIEIADIESEGGEGQGA